MKNPAEIPSSVMRAFECYMVFAADLQATRRHIRSALGQQHWVWHLDNPYSCCRQERSMAADRIKKARRLIRENGYDVAEVCSIARDPGMYAFCDGGGAAPADFE